MQAAKEELAHRKAAKSTSPPVRHVQVTKYIHSSVPGRAEMTALVRNQQEQQKLEKQLLRSEQERKGLRENLLRAKTGMRGMVYGVCAYMCACLCMKYIILCTYYIYLCVCAKSVLNLHVNQRCTVFSKLHSLSLLLCLHYCHGLRSVCHKGEPGNAEEPP